jgi:GTP-binding protein
MAGPLDLRFVTSADSLSGLPDSPAEVAVAGRSNVGKSSLLNALANRTGLAQTSKSPGRTRLLNCYRLEGAGTVVDLPGYGYAKAPAAQRARWQRMIEGYLLGRDALVMVLVLVDAEIGPTPLDAQMLSWLRAHGLPHTVVATKQDKVRPSRREARKGELASGCGLPPSEVVWVSATKGTGIERLRAMLRSLIVSG